MGEPAKEREGEVVKLRATPLEQQFALVQRKMQSVRIFRALIDQCLESTFLDRVAKTTETEVAQVEEIMQDAMVYFEEKATAIETGNYVKDNCLTSEDVQVLKALVEQIQSKTANK